MSKTATTLRAAVLPIGLAGIAILLSYIISETATHYSDYISRGLDRTLNGHIDYLQNMSFQTFQLLFGLVIATAYWKHLLPDRLSWTWSVSSIVLGALLSALVSPDVRSVFLIFADTGSRPAPLPLPEGFKFLFGIPIVHAGLWMLRSAILVPFNENLLYRGILFKEAESLPKWAVAILSYVVFCLAYSFSGGLDGLMLAAKIGLVFVGLRYFSGSFIYPALAQSSFEFLRELTNIFSVLPQ
jgi:hypothetical protein